MTGAAAGTYMRLCNLHKISLAEIGLKIVLDAPPLR
jgi:hypothetical protein